MPSCSSAPCGAAKAGRSLGDLPPKVKARSSLVLSDISGDIGAAQGACFAGCKLAVAFAVHEGCLMGSRSARIAVIWALALLTIWLGERFYRNYLWKADPPHIVNAAGKLS